MNLLFATGIISSDFVLFFSLLEVFYIFPLYRRLLLCFLHLLQDFIIFSPFITDFYYIFSIYHRLLFRRAILLAGRQSFPPNFCLRWPILDRNIGDWIIVTSLEALDVRTVYSIIWALHPDITTWYTSIVPSYPWTWDNMWRIS